MPGSVWPGFQFTFEGTDNELFNRNALRACDLFSFAIHRVGQFDCRPHDPPFLYDTASPIHAFAVGVLSSRNSYLGGEKASGPITYAIGGKQYVAGTGAGVMYVIALSKNIPRKGPLDRRSLHCAALRSR
jgi:hypothetical protein